MDTETVHIPCSSGVAAVTFPQNEAVVLQQDTQANGPLLVTRNNQSNTTAYLQGRHSNKKKFGSSYKIFHQLFWTTCRKIK